MVIAKKLEGFGVEIQLVPGTYTLKMLRQPASADVLSTYFCRRFSTFCCINLKQQVEKTQKSAEAKILSWLTFFFFTVFTIF